MKLDGIKQLTERRRCAFIKRLLGDCRFSNLLLMHVQNAIFSIGLRVDVWMCVYLVAFYGSFIFKIFFVCVSCYSFNCVYGRL